MTFPDRLGPLISRLESGQALTKKDVKAAAALQALDLVKIGEDFVREAVQRDKDRTAAMQKHLEALCQAETAP